MGKERHELGLEKLDERPEFWLLLATYVFLKMYFILCVFLHVGLCIHEGRCQWSLEDGIRVPPELELQAVISLWVLGTKLRSPASSIHLAPRVPLQPKAVYLLGCLLTVCPLVPYRSMIGQLGLRLLSWGSHFPASFSGPVDKCQFSEFRFRLQFGGIVLDAPR